MKKYVAAVLFGAAMIAAQSTVAAEDKTADVTDMEALRKAVRSDKKVLVASTLKLILVSPGKSRDEISPEDWKVMLQESSRWLSLIKLPLAATVTISYSECNNVTFLSSSPRGGPVQKVPSNRTKPACLSALALAGLVALTVSSGVGVAAASSTSPKVNTKKAKPTSKKPWPSTPPTRA